MARFPWKRENGLLLFFSFLFLFFFQVETIVYTSLTVKLAFFFFSAFLGFVCTGNLTLKRGR